MVNAMTVIRAYKQNGGVLKKKQFTENHFGGAFLETKTENIRPQVTGVIVDNIVSHYFDRDAKKSFNTSIKGALSGSMTGVYSDEVQETFLSHLEYLKKGEYLSDEYIKSASYVCHFDSHYKSGLPITVELIVEPDTHMIERIRLLVKRTLNYLEDNVVSTEFSFDGGYTDIITIAEGDFITNNALIDLKVKSTKLSTRDSLQMLVYYLLGQNTGKEMFKNIEYIGTYNPRFDIETVIKVSDIDEEIFELVKTDVMGM